MLGVEKRKALPGAAGQTVGNPGKLIMPGQTDGAAQWTRLGETFAGMAGTPPVGDTTNTPTVVDVKIFVVVCRTFAHSAVFGLPIIVIIPYWRPCLEMSIKLSYF